MYQLSAGCDNYELMPDNFNYSNILMPLTAEFNETEPTDNAEL